MAQESNVTASGSFFMVQTQVTVNDLTSKQIESRLEAALKLNSPEISVP